MFGSSSGLGLRPFTAATRVRVPYRMPSFWSGSINGDALDCKSGASGTPGSIPGHSTSFSLIAQLVEHLTVNQVVPGSSPGRGAKIGAVVQLVRIHDCHSCGREFESRPFRQII